MHTTIDTTEARRLTEQERLDKQKDARERNRWGQFATPPQLSLDIARYAFGLWSQQATAPVRFLDPAIGTGAFYSAIRQVFPDHLLAYAAGIELDPSFAAAAKALWKSSGLRMTEADFTKETPRKQFNLILTNPPYVRHHHLATATKERLKQRVAHELDLDISGLAGLYCYFLLLADRWLAPDGVAIWLVPSEFMAVNYGIAVKEYLKRHVTLLQIHRFCPSDVQFSDALVSSAVVVFRKSPPPSGHQVLFSFGGTLVEPKTQRTIPAAELGLQDKWTKYPESANNHGEPAGYVTLGELFTINRGLATGGNEFFVVPRAKAKELGIPPQFCRAILPSPRHLRESVIETEPDGYPQLEEPLCLLDCDLPEERIGRQFPKFWNYLEQGKQRGVHEGYLARHRSPWYCQERRRPAPFLCTYMGRTSVSKAGKPFRFIWNKSQATAANVYLMLYPKPPLQQKLDESPRLYGQIYEGLTRITGEMFMDESRVYGGGLYKLEPKELARVSAEAILDAAKGLGVRPQKRLFA